MTEAIPTLCTSCGHMERRHSVGLRKHHPIAGPCLELDCHCRQYKAPAVSVVMK